MKPADLTRLSNTCREDAESFSQTLKEHQQARLPDGFTVLESAVIQHNVLSVSKMYNNISFEELSSVLGLPAAKAEMYASDMICEGRLLAHIDQVDNVIHFDDDMEQLRQWDEQIMSCCESINSVIAAINA